jgi:hypothetical protein
LVTFALTAANTTGAALGSNGVPFTPWMWLDVGICGVLAWGIYRRSRIAAALMFVYFTAAKALWVWNDLERFSGQPGQLYQRWPADGRGAGGGDALGVYGTVAQHRR